MLAIAENMNENSTVDDFLKEIPTEQDSNKDLFKEEPKEELEKKEEVSEEEPHKNRKHRRWEDKLEQKERDLIEREARLKTIEELSQRERFTKEIGQDEWADKLGRLYGTDDQGKQAAQLTRELLESVSRKTREETLNEIEQKRKEESAEQARHESFIDSELESLEEEYNVDLTSNAPAARKARKEFLDMLQQFSPKDAEGTLTGFADFSATYEHYQLKKAQDKSSSVSDKQKELASRSMVKPGSADVSGAKRDDMRDYLRSIGIGV